MTNNLKIIISVRGGTYFFCSVYDESAVYQNTFSGTVRFHSEILLTWFTIYCNISKSKLFIFLFFYLFYFNLFIYLFIYFFAFAVTSGIAYGTNDAFYYSLHKRQMNAFAI